MHVFNQSRYILHPGDPSIRYEMIRRGSWYDRVKVKVRGSDRGRGRGRGRGRRLM